MVVVRVSWKGRCTCSASAGGRAVSASSRRWPPPPPPSLLAAAADGPGCDTRRQLAAVTSRISSSSRCRALGRQGGGRMSRGLRQAPGPPDASSTKWVAWKRAKFVACVPAPGRRSACAHEQALSVRWPHSPFDHPPITATDRMQQGLAPQSPRISPLSNQAPAGAG